MSLRKSLVKRLGYRPGINERWVYSHARKSIKYLNNHFPSLLGRSKALSYIERRSMTSRYHGSKVSGSQL